MAGLDWISKKDFKLTTIQRKFIDKLLENDISAISTKYKGELFIVLESEKDGTQKVKHDHVALEFSDASRVFKLTTKDFDTIQTRYGKYYIRFNNENKLK